MSEPRVAVSFDSFLIRELAKISRIQFAERRVSRGHRTSYQNRPSATTEFIEFILRSADTGRASDRVRKPVYAISLLRLIGMILSAGNLDIRGFTNTVLDGH